MDNRSIKILGEANNMDQVANFVKEVESLKDAEKQAEKNCKKGTGDKQCKALISSAKNNK